MNESLATDFSGVGEERCEAFFVLRGKYICRGDLPTFPSHGCRFGALRILKKGSGSPFKLTPKIG